MKTIHWVIIAISASIILLGVNIAIIIFTETSWWWILVSIVALILGWGIFGVVKLIGKLRKKAPEKEEVNVKVIKNEVIRDVMYDNENADNFKIEKEIIRREGREGSEPTPILWLSGVGTETDNKIDVLVNLNHKKERIRLNNVPDDKIEGIVARFAENPDIKVVEERTQTTDQFGRPTQTVKVVRSSPAKEKEKQEKEEAEKASAF